MINIFDTCLKQSMPQILLMVIDHQNLEFDPDFIAKSAPALTAWDRPTENRKSHDMLYKVPVG